MQRKLITLAALAVTVAALGGVGYAAIPGANGVISACRDSKGSLKVIDAEAGQACNANQQPLNWNQQGPPGPQGPAGPAGSVKAYAEIDYWGAVGGGNLTNANVVKGGTGHYCFGGLEFTPQTAIVTLGSQSPIAGTPTVRVRLNFDAGGCPVSHRQALVSLYDPETQTFDDEEFFILIN